MYFMSGRTQQLVWPYMVSGRSVAATRNTGLLPAALHKEEGESVTMLTHTELDRKLSDREVNNQVV